MKIKLRIIDQDLNYAESMATKLGEHFQSLDITAIPIPLFVSEDEIEHTIDLFNVDQYPSYKPVNRYIAIKSEKPFVSAGEKNKPTTTLSRFSPIKMFISTIESEILKLHPNYFKMNLISTYIIEESSKAVIHKIAKEIASFSKQKYKFILNIGPDSVFPRNRGSSSLSISKMLLKISLRNFNSSEVGQYIENSPLSPSLMRFTLCENHDDWVLASEGLVRETLEIIKSWLDSNYKNNWELYLISINMPHKINLLLSSLSQRLSIFVSDFQESEDRYLPELIANLPKDSTYKIEHKLNIEEIKL